MSPTSGCLAHRAVHTHARVLKSKQNTLPVTRCFVYSAEWRLELREATEKLLGRRVSWKGSGSDALRDACNAVRWRLGPRADRLDVKPISLCPQHKARSSEPPHSVTDIEAGRGRKPTVGRV